ncbi:MAG: hypothetical protein QM645_07910 [Asticcacaulis sp.]
MGDYSVRITKPALALTLAAVLLSGCSAVVLAPKGPLAVGSAQVSLSRDWSDITKLYYQRAKKVKVLSLDGPGLNRLYISDGLSSKDPLMVHPQRGDRKSAPAPRGKANMSFQEHIEYVSTSLGVIDLQQVTTSSPKPVDLGGTRAVRFDITAKTPEGLDLKGVAQAYSKGNLNYYIIYIAPAEHYYGAALNDVLTTMDSSR